jgi:hypothetical protein
VTFDLESNMTNHDDEMRDRILRLSDGQLRRMVTMDAANYRSDAIAIANDELVRRGLEPGVTGEGSDEPQIDCLRCKSRLVYGGKKRFSDGPRLGGVIGAITEIAAKHDEIELWICRKCGHVELFTEPEG